MCRRIRTSPTRKRPAASSRPEKVIPGRLIAAASVHTGTDGIRLHRQTPALISNRQAPPSYGQILCKTCPDRPPETHSRHTPDTLTRPAARIRARIRPPSGPQLVAGTEHPRDHQGTHQQNEQNGEQTDVMVHIGHAVKTPAKAADQIHHRVK